MADDTFAMRTLRAATRLRLRGRPWSWVAKVIGAAAAGALDPDDVRQGVADAWELYDPADVGNFELMAWEKHLIERVLVPRSRLLIIGSGAGRDLVAYAQLGFDVAGIEPAPIAARTSIEQLRGLGLRGEVITGFAEDVDIRGQFDAVIFSYFCYAYIPGSARRVALLKKLRPHLADRAQIVLTYNPRPAFVLTPLTQLTARLTGSRWRPESGDAVYLMGRSETPFAVEHHFREAEVAAEARAAGYAPTFQGPVGEVLMLIATDAATRSGAATMTA